MTSIHSSIVDRVTGIAHTRDTFTDLDNARIDEVCLTVDLALTSSSSLGERVAAIHAMR
jgi:hypothetical protein